jgi:hypothetical protein
MVRQREQESEGEPETNRGGKGKELDLSRLDEKSVKIMVMLMLFLLENNMTALEFFDGVTYQQNVKSKERTQTLDCIRSEDFFQMLQARGIRKKETEHENLREFLQLSPQFPDVIVLKSVRRTLEQMAENEEFMEAIREDIMMAEQNAQD